MQRTIRREKSRGQAVVEFALILPVFLLVTLGVVDMARLFTAYVALTNGVSNGALYASQGGWYKWCNVGTSPIAGTGCTTGTQTNSDPDNIAYQIQVETTGGLILGNINMASPQCKLPDPSVTVTDCTLHPVDSYATVRVSASYQLNLLTPLVSVILGGPVRMTATTTAVIY